MSRNKKLGEILMARGVIDEPTLGKALERQKRGERKLIGVILVDLGSVESEQVVQSLAIQWGVPYVDPTRAKVDPGLLAQVPRGIVERSLLLPIERLPSGLIQVAMANPRDINAIQDIEFILRSSVVPVISSERKIKIAIDRHYSLESGARKLLEGLDEDLRAPVVSPSSLELDQAQVLGRLKGDAAGGYIDLLNYLLANAIERRASDIHFESQSESIRVRFRIDGLLREVLSLPRWVGPPLFNRIKVVGNLEIDGQRPQDGKSSARLGRRAVDLRIATVPSQFGEKVVIRILDPALVRTDLGQLGWQPRSLKDYYRLVANPQGLVLAVGPTGSGKSTTLYATIHRLLSESTSIITVEDPIEYTVEGITQIQVNQKAGFTFDKAVRSLLRQDPNVIVIGEIRDDKTAEVAFEAASTGHLVLSSAHTSHAISAITRLRELGVLPYLLGSTLNGIVAQRLVRRVCPECSIPDEPELEDWERLGVGPRDLGREVRRAGPGCPTCQYAGYSGRVGIFEVFAVSELTRNMLTEQASEFEVWRQAQREGLITLMEDALEKVARGVTTFDEVARVVPPDPWRDEGERAVTVASSSRPTSSSRGDVSKITEPVEELRVPTPEDLVPKGPPSVLIADDAEEILRLVTLTLEDEYRIITARDGIEVLEKSSLEVPDLFILDVMMPRMSGFEVCEELKERTDTLNVPVLFLSARGEPPHVKRGFHVGADDYLAKPFDPEELILRVRALLRRSRRARG